YKSATQRCRRIKTVARYPKKTRLQQGVTIEIRVEMGFIYFTLQTPVQCFFGSRAEECIFNSRCVAHLYNISLISNAWIYTVQVFIPGRG
ncbi:MAG TPA: hypothetical protein VF610_10420, partial [Segetibacter sp.]